ncbi:MAG: hypothetical protein HXX11_01525 [Desulfuromonadales bacterium]|nr:hypothetical protein [Desulfuromonadales bacterium]
MNTIKKVDHNVTEEEVQKIKNLDWDGYFKSFTNMDESIRTCPKCKVMIFPQQGETEFICKRCEEKIIL